MQTRDDLVAVRRTAEQMPQPFIRRADLHEELQHRYNWGRARCYRLIARSITAGDLIAQTPRILMLAQQPLELTHAELEQLHKFKDRTETA